MPKGNINIKFVYFIQIPLALAYATLDALARGEAKLSRGAVLKLTQNIDDQI